MGLDVGMTMAIFLWTSTFLTLRATHWQSCGIGALITCACHAISFVWFYTKRCSTTTTNYDDFLDGREVEMGHPYLCTSPATVL